MESTLPDPNPETVIVGLSGGVDSAVAALLLKKLGHQVQGLFMSNWEHEDDGYCTAAADFQDARRVCEALDIPLHRVSFAGEYRERVFRQFLREYEAGRTPNPDVLCNREIKFGVCLEYMHRLGAGRIATGHYARLRRTEHGTELLKAADESKDQSYFLHSVDPAALDKTLFPLGELRKDEVRRQAHAAGLSVHDKPDSTGICFIGERPFENFLGRYIQGSAGPIEDPAFRSTPSASDRDFASAAGRGARRRRGMSPPRIWSAMCSSWCRITTIRCSCRPPSRWRKSIG
jgi:tRNA-specific 2-thiouridylase